MSSARRIQENLERIAQAAIDAAAPGPAIRKLLTINDDALAIADQSYRFADFDRILLLGAGKGSAAMARVMEDLLGPRLHSGIAVTKYDHGLDVQKTEILEAAHPVPDQAGLTASRTLLNFARQTTQRDLVFFLLSGGASALTPCPTPPLTLEMKQQTTQKLLECGADIHEINAIRKHLSCFKGGRLAAALEPCTTVSLIISDVVGDDLDVIGSGPTVPDRSTFADCLRILDTYELRKRIPADVLEFLHRGAKAEEPETLQQGHSCFEHIFNHIIASNAGALQAAAECARRLGFETAVMKSPIQGEAREVGRRLMTKAVNLAKNKSNDSPPVCLTAGGESTVTIQGTGKGGRNQETVLAAATALQAFPEYAHRIGFLSLGTDGTDGPTDAAGAFILPGTMEKAQATGLSAADFLVDNDSYSFFEKLGLLYKTGPTRTNVMDIVIVLIDG